MQTIYLETRIAAPRERCFLLSLNVDLHKGSTAQTSEQAIAGVTSGIIGPNESVTWRARHFGFTLTHETLIPEYNYPTHFQDIMTKGMFKSFVHDHHFEPLENGSATLMRDKLTFAAPLGVIGSIVESLVLKSYLTRFLAERNRIIREVAEDPSERWRDFVEMK
jgi:ligand-binding SRPBCC domain-containing protein